MKIAYVMSRFPNLSETFILREMEALEATGATVVAYPLVVQRQPVMHKEAARWVADLRATTPWSLHAWAAVAQLAFSVPMTFARAFTRIVRENRSSPKFLLRALAIWPMALHAALAMKAEGVDHVHAHYATHPALFAWLVNAFSGLPYSVTVHAHDIFVDRSMLATKLGGASFIAAISTFNRNFLIDKLGDQLASRIHVVRCGIDPSFYGEPRATRVGEASAGIEPFVERPHEPSIFEIVSVGSLQPYKGHQYLVNACAGLAHRGLDFRCRIVGEGVERESLERLIDECCLAGRVVLEGAMPQDQVAKRLREADVYVQPSVVEKSGKKEGIPVALMEAMASGVPVIATRLSGVPELVQDGLTGLLVEPGDASALVNAVCEIQRQPAAADLRARAARDLIKQEYDLHDNVVKLYALMSGAQTGHLVESHLRLQKVSP